MLTDTALKQLKTKEKDYKLADRDGMYVVVKKNRWSCVFVSTTACTGGGRP